MPSASYVLLVPRREAGVDHLAVDEFSLQVGGEQINAADAALISRSICEESAGGRVTQRSEENLVVLDARLERVALTERRGAP